MSELQVWLSGEEAAEYTGIGWQTLRRIIVDNAIPHLRVGPRWKIQRVTLDEHLARLAEQQVAS